MHYHYLWEHDWEEKWRRVHTVHAQQMAREVWDLKIPTLWRQWFRDSHRTVQQEGLRCRQRGRCDIWGMVEKLMTDSRLLNKGFHLYMDNFYTKSRIAQLFYDNKTLMTGAVRSNTRGMPTGWTQMSDSPNFGANSTATCLRFPFATKSRKPSLCSFCPLLMMLDYWKGLSILTQNKARSHIWL